MPAADPDAVLRRLTGRLAPLKRDLHRAVWEAGKQVGAVAADDVLALVESLQGVARPDGRPAPDWASKIHLAVAPVYYQSYLLGELLASQLDQAVRERAGGFLGRPDAGAFLGERVFAPGATLPWRDLAAATGHQLGPAAFLAGLAA